VRPNLKKGQFRHSELQMPHRIREGLLLLLCAAALFLFVSFSTYTRSDPSWTNLTVTHQVFNRGGKVGAWLADIFFLLFGYVAYLFPSLMLYWGAHSLRHRYEEVGLLLRDKVIKALGFICLLLSACGLAHYYWGAHGFILPAHAGGILGYIISSSLAHVFNFHGSLLLLVTGILCGTTLCTGFSWLSLLDKLGLWLYRLSLVLWKWLMEKWEEERQEQQKLEALRAKMLGRYERDEEKPSRPLPAKPKPFFAASEETKEKPLEAVKLRLIKSQIMKPVSSIFANKTEVKEESKPRPTPRYAELIKPMASEVQLKQGMLPPLSLLNPPVSLEQKPFSQLHFDELSDLVEQRLMDFGVEVKVVAVHPGPVITRFELELAPGIKVSKISGLSKDIARSLSVASVRVVEVIPGKPVIGLEIANENREVVALRDICESAEYAHLNSPVSLALGKDIAGVPVTVDLAKMPHLLVAGTTGSGKSVSLNAMLLSMLYKATPEELRFILIDPKMLELSVYEGIPHLLTPVITDMKDASNALRWCVIEMDKRYRLMSGIGVRNLAGYNLKIQEAKRLGNPIAPPQWMMEKEGEAAELKPLPLIVVVADELADMMMVVGKKVEELVVRLAQKARAAGIHLILATQRPSVDVITGLIKANIPTRIAFQVSSRIDSRTILDQQGAEQLLGYGDMLYLPAGAGIPMRIHGAYVTDEEVHRVVAAWQSYAKPEYLNSVTEDIEEANQGEDGPTGEADPLYDQAVQIVTESRRASISFIQRRLRIGYNRAARLMEDMEIAGLVSAVDHSGSREVLAEEH